MKRAVLLSLTIFLASCNNQGVKTPATPTLEGYVALGDSLTAGFQSNGLTADGQRKSFPVLLSKLAGYPINAPLGKNPGCPPPLPKTLLDVTADSCTRLEPDARIGNLGVPGARLEDLNTRTSANLSSNNPGEAALYNLILGPTETQVSAAIKAKPQFITLWTGSNNWVLPLLSLPPTPITSAEIFETQYAALLEALKPATDGAKVVLITVPGPEQAPVITSSATLLAFGVGEEDCKTSLNKFNGVYVLKMFNEKKKIACSTDPNVLTPALLEGTKKTIDAYNASIRKLALARGFKVFDVSTLTATTLKNEYNPFSPNQPFGADLSLDGVHPSSAGYAKIANALGQFINESFGTKIPIPAS